MACEGKDVTKDFDTVGHSDFAREMAKQYLVGEYKEVSGQLNNQTLV